MPDDKLLAMLETWIKEVKEVQKEHSVKLDQMQKSLSEATNRSALIAQKVEACSAFRNDCTCIFKDHEDRIRYQEKKTLNDKEVNKIIETNPEFKELRKTIYIWSGIAAIVAIAAPYLIRFVVSHV